VLALAGAGISLPATEPAGTIRAPRPFIPFPRLAAGRDAANSLGLGLCDFACGSEQQQGWDCKFCLGRRRQERNGCRHGMVGSEAGDWTGWTAQIDRGMERPADPEGRGALRAKLNLNGRPSDSWSARRDHLHVGPHPLFSLSA